MSDPVPSNSIQATRALSGGARSTPHAEHHSVDAAAQPLSPAPSHKVRGSDVLCKADLTRDDLTGLAFGPYALGEKLGGGGMGKIFAATHVHLEREFAIKFIASSAAHAPESRARFDQEVKALGKLQHPNIVSAVDAGSIDGLQYLATERIYGQDLAAIVDRRGALPIADACEVVRQVALGLEHSHAAGILHRDIKPSNLILDRLGVVKILDFGLGCQTKAGHDLTSDGMLLGTLDFLSPEQAQDARQIDARSDLYSLGCTLLYLLSGQLPFGDERYATAAAKIKGHLLDTPDWLDSPGDMPPALVDIVRRLLAKNPVERFASAAELAAALLPWCHGHQVARLLEESAKPTPAVRPASTFPSNNATWLLGASILGGGLILMAIIGGSILAWNMGGYAATKSPEQTVAAVNPESALFSKQLDLVPSSTPKPSTDEPLAEAAEPLAESEIVTGETKQTADASAVQFDFSGSAGKANVDSFPNGAEETDWRRPLSDK